MTPSIIYNFTRFNVNNGGRWSDGMIAPHAGFLPCSEIAVCLETGYTSKVSDRVFSLSGEWEVALADERSETFVSEKATFVSATVPDSVPAYALFDNPEGKCFVYRKEFEIFNPGYKNTVYFERVGGSFEVYLNGEPIGASRLGYGEFDLGKAAVKGNNVLVVRVASDASGRKVDPARDEAEGIFGDVKLIVRKDAYLKDYTFLSSRDGLDSVGRLKLYAEAGENVRACVVLADGEEIISETETVFVNGEAEAVFSGKFNIYSAEKPYLYDVYVRILDGEEEKECSVTRIGFAPTETDGDGFILDGTPIELKGAVYYPDGVKDYRDELNIMKSFNMNAVWVRGVCTSDFYDACAETGMYVINEIPFARETVRKEKMSKHRAVADADGYMASVAERLAAVSAAYPCVIAYAFGKMTDSPEGKANAELIAKEYAKPVAGINFGAVPSYADGARPIVAFIPADKLTPEGAEALLRDKECAGVFVDAYRAEDGTSGLFDLNNIESKNAIIVKYVFRPYTASLADNRTLFITNTKSFGGSDGLTVTLSKVNGGKEEAIQRISPVIAAGQTREYGIYLGEYDEHTKIRVRYEENGAHIATETLSPRFDDELPEYRESLKGVNYEYEVVNKEFNLNKIEENVLPARSAFVPCSSEKVCNAGDNDTGSGASDRTFTLSGEWDFAYFAENAPTNFGGDGMKWEKIKLPATWESAGYEKFAYSYGYPFEANIKKFEIKDNRENKNSAGIYRKFINVADGEYGHILSFGKVNGSIELQINGRYVGYSMTGSAEFDISEFLRLGENEIVVIVKKWTPAAFLYGADGFLASGIIGDVSLIKYRKSSLFDYDFKTKKEGKVYSALLSLKFFTAEPGKCKVELKKGGRTVYENVCEKQGGVAELEIKDEFVQYDTETCETYDLFVKVVENGFVTECTKLNVGFNEINVIGDTAYYNGEPVKIRGIVYNAVYNASGEPLGAEDVRRDLGLIKAYGFNAVMPTGYVAPGFVSAARKIGLFVIGGAGIDTEAAGAKGAKNRDAVINEKAFGKLIEKTVLNAYTRDKNACNVPMFFIAENGDAERVAKCVSELKKFTEKPVFCYGTKSGDGIIADFPAVNDVVDLINEAAGKKPLFLARYALSTGIGCATMNAYEDLISSTPCCMGGCVAYFVDEVIGGEGRKACGIFTADRQPYAGAEFIKYLYRPIRSEVIEGATAIELTNTRRVLSTDDLTVRLNVVVDGKAMSGTMLDVNVLPGETKRYDIFVGHIEGDMFLDVEYYSKKTGALLYTEQHELNNTMKVISPEKGVNPLICTELFDYLDIEFDCGSVRFNKRLGSISRYVLQGKELLKSDSVQKGGNGFVNNIRRPFVRNLNGKTPVVTSKVRDFECDYNKEGTFGSVHVNIENILSLDGKESYIVQDKYIVDASGAIEIFSVLTPLRRGLPVMDCFGKQIRFNNAFGNVIYYGNGEGDNYIDMCEHTRVGLFGLNVDKTFEKLPVLQECGNRTNVRCAVIRDNDGDGVVISARKVPFQMRISPYSDKQIAEAFVSGEKPSQSGVYVDVNAFVSGIGSSENGYPLPQYVICSGEHFLHFDFIPLSACK